MKRNCIAVVLMGALLLLRTPETPAQTIDIQAHRGGMALYPENTIVAMLNALDWGVNTLEMDLVVSKDKKIVVSHEPVMCHRYVADPCGKAIAQADEMNYRLYTMPYDSIARYDTGIRGDARFPQRKKVPAHKPLLSDLIDATEAYAKQNGMPLPCYNIEIKSSQKNDSLYTPDYREFADLALDVLLQKNLGKRLIIQCFDVRTLNYLHERYPRLRLSYLIGKTSRFQEALSKLRFVPEYLSPDYTIVNKALVAAAHEKGMKIVPWTVDSYEDMRRMIELNVDGLITNYPDRAVRLTRFLPQYQVGIAQTKPGK